MIKHESVKKQIEKLNDSFLNLKASLDNASNYLSVLSEDVCNLHSMKIKAKGVKQFNYPECLERITESGVKAAEAKTLEFKKIDEHEEMMSRMSAPSSGGSGGGKGGAALGQGGGCIGGYEPFLFSSCDSGNWWRSVD